MSTGEATSVHLDCRWDFWLKLRFDRLQMRPLNIPIVQNRYLETIMKSLVHNRFDILQMRPLNISFVPNRFRRLQTTPLNSYNTSSEQIYQAKIKTTEHTTREEQNWPTTNETTGCTTYPIQIWQNTNETTEYTTHTVQIWQTTDETLNIPLIQYRFDRLQKRHWIYHSPCADLTDYKWDH